MWVITRSSLYRWSLYRESTVLIFKYMWLYRLLNYKTYRHEAVISTVMTWRAAIKSLYFRKLISGKVTAVNVPELMLFYMKNGSLFNRWIEIKTNKSIVFIKWPQATLPVQFWMGHKLVIDNLTFAISSLSSVCAEPSVEHFIFIEPERELRALRLLFMCV